MKCCSDYSDCMLNVFQKESLMKRSLLLLLVSAVLVLMFAAVGNANATTIYVNQAAPGPTHDGTTWDTAFITVKAGTDVAVSGDEVWVAKGTYIERITLKDAVALYAVLSGHYSNFKLIEKLAKYVSELL